MGLRELIDKVKGMTDENELDPDEPKSYKIDRYLESLRIERQRQLEEQEKIRLKKSIAEYKKKCLRERMFGMRNKFEKKSRYLKGKRKAGNILKNTSKWL